jgi:hypothetical protein
LRSPCARGGGCCSLAEEDAAGSSVVSSKDGIAISYAADGGFAKASMASLIAVNLHSLMTSPAKTNDPSCDIWPIRKNRVDDLN